MELVCVDFLKLEEASGGFKYILLIIDHFSGFAQAYGTKNKSALTVAKKMYGDFILRYGIPSRIHHDQGSEFENKLFEELEKLCGIIRSRTTPYHPQGNGAVERMNRTLLQMMRTLTEKQKKSWHLHLNQLTFAYNSTKHDVTGYSPYFLMHGREPRLPLDEILNIDDGKTRKDYAQYIKTWQAQMDEAWKIANEKSAKRKTADRRRWNKTARLTELQCGDRVLVKNLTPREGPGKLRNYWEDTIHTVTRIVGDTNVVYEVQAEGNARARKRVLHRNMLMPCQELILNKDDKAIKTKKKTKQPATVTNARNQPTEPVENIDIDSSDSEEEYVLQIRNNETVDAQPLQNDDNIQVDENVENDNEAQEIDEGEGEKKWMPIKLMLWVRRPSKSTQVVPSPD